MSQPRVDCFCESLIGQPTRHIFQAVSVGVDAAELFESAMLMTAGGKQAHRHEPANRFVGWAG